MWLYIEGEIDLLDDILRMPNRWRFLYPEYLSLSWFQFSFLAFIYLRMMWIFDPFCFFSNSIIIFLLFLLFVDEVGLLLILRVYASRDCSDLVEEDWRCGDVSNCLRNRGRDFTFLCLALWSGRNCLVGFFLERQTSFLRLGQSQFTDCKCQVLYISWSIFFFSIFLLLFFQCDPLIFWYSSDSWFFWEEHRTIRVLAILIFFELNKRDFFQQVE